MYVYITTHFVNRQRQRLPADFDLISAIRDIFFNKKCYEVIEDKKRFCSKKYYSKINDGRKVRYKNILFVFNDDMTVLKSCNVRDLSYFKFRKNQLFLIEKIGGYTK